MPTNGPDWKQKIGSHLCYPIKFSEVVEELDVHVDFSGWKAPRQTEKRPIYSVMEAKHSTHPLLKPWRVIVLPVPRELRSAVRSALIPSGTDKVRALLRGPHSQLKLAEPHVFRLRFVAATESLEYDAA